METFFQQLINGISQGSAYALIALGYTMVYGVLKLINFAHSDVVVLDLPIASGRPRPGWVSDSRSRSSRWSP